MSDNKEVSQESFIPEIPEPMEQDGTKTTFFAAPIIPTPAEQSSSSQSIGGGTNKTFLQKLFGEKATEKPTLTFAERLLDLENRELFSNGLSADEYIEFILMDIITGKRNFVDTLYRAQQRSSDSTIKSLSALVGFITTWNIKAALKHLRSMKFKQEKNQKLATEVENRLRALLLMIVSRSYCSAKSEYLGTFLEFTNKQDFQNFLAMLDWEMTANETVKISFNSKVKDYVFTKLINPEMGQFELIERMLPETNENVKEVIPLDRIRQIMSISDQLMKVTLPKSSDNEKKNPTKTFGNSIQANGTTPRV